ncbi:hypothetical protein HYH03_004214 [Edaphochlamys debaryana]|uniref:Protein kinase domain-containing protein n=1 Tax=Edaphochlamys debaryana TaxID=47281 RepID=A0A836C3N0_9CHLO|nr:hypothetical protein HYH03_004214 [Edaphochlamys debaryana]|eukprot:KAG2497952.1 hypothetical protein HYH03_004214 [Edaphochlamys debaryana]
MAAGPATSGASQLAAAIEQHQPPRLLVKLLKAGASVDATDLQGRTPLHISVLAGNAEAVTVLLDHASKVTRPLRGPKGDPSQAPASPWALATAPGPAPARPSPLHLAAERNEAILRIILSHSSLSSVGASFLGIALSSRPHPALLELRDARGWTLLHYAVSRGNTASLRLLLQFISGLEDGSSSSGDSHRASLVVKRPCSGVNITDHNGHTPLHQAALVGDAECCRLLLKAGADIAAVSAPPEGALPLHLAACGNNPASVEALFRHAVAQAGFRAAQAVLLRPNAAGQTALHVAVLHGGGVETARRLLHLVFPVDTRGPVGRTAFHLAALKGSTDMLQMLLRHSTPQQRELRDDEGFTAAHLAAAAGRLEALRTLASGGVSMDASAARAAAALAAAAAGGAVANVPGDCEGWRPLHCAVRRGDLATIEVLVAELGADPYAKDARGRSPCDLVVAVATAAARDANGVVEGDVQRLEEPVPDPEEEEDGKPGAGAGGAARPGSGPTASETTRRPLASTRTELVGAGSDGIFRGPSLGAHGGAGMDVVGHDRLDEPQALHVILTFVRLLHDPLRTSSTVHAPVPLQSGTLGTTSTAATTTAGPAAAAPPPPPPPPAEATGGNDEAVAFQRPSYDPVVQTKGEADVILRLEEPHGPSTAEVGGVKAIAAAPQSTDSSGKSSSAAHSQSAPTLIVATPPRPSPFGPIKGGAGRASADRGSIERVSAPVGVGHKPAGSPAEPPSLALAFAAHMLAAPAALPPLPPQPQANPQPAARAQVTRPSPFGPKPSAPRPSPFGPPGAPPKLADATAAEPEQVVVATLGPEDGVERSHPSAPAGPGTAVVAGAPVQSTKPSPFGPARRASPFQPQGHANARPASVQPLPPPAPHPALLAVAEEFPKRPLGSTSAPGPFQTLGDIPAPEAPGRRESGNLPVSRQGTSQQPAADSSAQGTSPFATAACSPYGGTGVMDSSLVTAGTGGGQSASGSSSSIGSAALYVISPINSPFGYSTLNRAILLQRNLIAAALMSTLPPRGRGGTVVMAAGAARFTSTALNASVAQTPGLASAGPSAGAGFSPRHSLALSPTQSQQHLALMPGGSSGQQAGGHSNPDSGPSGGPGSGRQGKGKGRRASDRLRALLSTKERDRHPQHLNPQQQPLLQHPNHHQSHANGHSTQAVQHEAPSRQPTAHSHSHLHIQPTHQLLHPYGYASQQLPYHQGGAGSAASARPPSNALPREPSSRFGASLSTSNAPLVAVSGPCVGPVVAPSAAGLAPGLVAWDEPSDTFRATSLNHVSRVWLQWPGVPDPATGWLLAEMVVVDTGTPGGHVWLGLGPLPDLSPSLGSQGSTGSGAMALPSPAAGGGAGAATGMGSCPIMHNPATHVVCIKDGQAFRGGAVVPSLGSAVRLEARNGDTVALFWNRKGRAVAFTLNGHYCGRLADIPAEDSLAPLIGIQCGGFAFRWRCGVSSPAGGAAGAGGRRSNVDGLMVREQMLHEDPETPWQCKEPSMTSLHFAAWGGNLRVLPQLVRTRAFHPDEPDADGWTPLHFAALAGRLDAVRELLGLGASPDVRSRYGATPAMLAAKYGRSRDHVALVRALSDAGADLTCRDARGRTLLMLAAKAGSLAMVQLLLDRGVDPSATDHQDREAQQYAGQHGAVFRLLRNAQAAQRGEGRRQRDGAAATGAQPRGAASAAAQPQAQAQALQWRDGGPTPGTTETGAATDEDADVDPHGRVADSRHLPSLAEQWRVGAGQLVRGRLIEQGAFGAVFEGTWCGARVAIKQIVRGARSNAAAAGEAGAADGAAAAGPAADGAGGAAAGGAAGPGTGAGVEAEASSLEREVAILAALPPHERIARMLGSVELPGEGLCLVMAYYPHTLQGVMQTERLRRSWLTPSRRAAIARQLAEGLAFLHSLPGCRLIHRDLKPNNVLLEAPPSLDVKICDFGLSRILAENDVQSSSAAGHAFWMAPELLRGRPYDEKVDTYSFGVILYQLAYWVDDQLYGGLNKAQVDFQVVHGLLRLQDRLTSAIDPAVAALVRDCVDEDPRNRPSMASVVTRLAGVREFPQPQQGGAAAAQPPAPLSGGGAPAVVAAVSAAAAVGPRASPGPADEVGAGAGAVVGGGVVGGAGAGAEQSGGGVAGGVGRTTPGKPATAPAAEAIKPAKV